MEFNEEERSLFAQGAALQAKAKAARRARVEEQKRIDAASDAAKKARAKGEKDVRIRRAVLKMAEAAKAEGLAFEAPWGFYGTTPKQKAFTLVDTREGGKIEISTHPTGFSWD